MNIMYSQICEHMSSKGRDKKYMAFINSLSFIKG